MPRGCAEVDVAGQLAQDQDVEAGDDLRLQRRRAGEFGVDRRRAQVGEEAELLAQPQERLLRALRARQLVVLRTADRAEEDRVGALARAPASPPAADRRRRRRRLPPTGASASSSASPSRASARRTRDRLRDDLGTDAVAGEDRDLQLNSHGCSARRRSSNARIFSAWRSVRPISSRPFRRQCLRNGVDLEAERARSVGVGDGLRREVDDQPEAGERSDVVEEAVDLARRKHDRQEPVLEAVVEEDVAERRRDHRAEAVVHQRPRRMLARGAAAEVLAREQDRRAPVARLVQHEVGVERALRRGPCPARRGRGSARRRTGSARSRSA